MINRSSRLARRYRNQGISMFKFFKIIVLCVFCYSCSVKDEALPLNQDNLNKLVAAIKKESGALPLSQSKERDYAVLELYKISVERLGYSFDKTIGEIILFSNGNCYFEIFYPAITLIRNNTEESLRKNYISQTTAEIITLMKDNKAISEKELEFIGYVEKCQHENGGSCNEKKLIQILEQNNIRVDVPQSDNFFSIHMNQKLTQNYGLLEAGKYQWLVKPDGESLNTNALFNGNNIHFLVNKSKVNNAIKLSKNN